VAPQPAPVVQQTAPVTAAPEIVQQPPAPQYTPPPTSSPAAEVEPTVGVLGGFSLQKGLFKSENYNLVVTTQRLAFARLTNEMRKAEIEMAKQQAKAEGKGFLKQWGAGLGAGRAIRERYATMSIDEIMREHPDNFTIPLGQINKVRLIRGSMDDEGGSSPDQMIIHAASKMKFTLTGISIGEVKQTLRQVLGNKVR
jgi:hypothetical protein